MENYKKLKHIILFIGKNPVKGALSSKTKVIEQKHVIYLCHTGCSNLQKSVHSS